MPHLVSNNESILQVPMVQWYGTLANLSTKYYVVAMLTSIEVANRYVIPMVDITSIKAWEVEG